MALFLKDYFVGYRICSWQFFSFSTWKMPCHFLWYLWFQMRYLPSSELMFLWQVIYSFFLSSFKNLSLFSEFNYVSWHWFPWNYPGGVCSASWNFKFVSFTKFGRVSGIISCHIHLDCFFSPSGALIQMLGFWLLHHRSERLSSFISQSILSLLFILSKFYFFLLKFTDSIQCHLHYNIKPIQKV